MINFKVVKKCLPIMYDYDSAGTRIPKDVGRVCSDRAPVQAIVRHGHGQWQHEWDVHAPTQNYRNIEYRTTMGAS